MFMTWKYTSVHFIQVEEVSPEQFDGNPVLESKETKVRSTKQSTTSKKTLATTHAVDLDRWHVCIIKTEHNPCEKTVAT